MRIEQLELQNFGPLEQLHLQFAPDRVNVLYGPNGAGKTQLLAALAAVFRGQEVLRYHPSSGHTGCTRLQLSAQDRRVTLVQRHTDRDSCLQFARFADCAQAARLDPADLVFCQPDLERRDRAYSPEELQAAEAFLQRLGAGECLSGRAGHSRLVLSYGEYRYLDTVCLLARLPAGAVLLGDGLLAGLDPTWCARLLQVLTRVRGVQVILAETALPQDPALHGLPLPAPARGLSPVSYNYRPLVCPGQPAGDRGVVPVLYRLGEAFPLGEEKAVELKEIRGNNACDSIVANAEIYVNAYLNSCLPDTGRIFWGVSDRRIVTGVRLSYQEKDRIQRRVSECLSQAEPFIDPDWYRIDFNPTADAAGRVQPDVYVVEIRVFPHRTNRLYATSKGDVYVKTPGGRKKLTSLQVQELVLPRNGR